MGVHSPIAPTPSLLARRSRSAMRSTVGSKSKRSFGRPCSSPQSTTRCSWTSVTPSVAGSTSPETVLTLLTDRHEQHALFPNPDLQHVVRTRLDRGIGVVDATIVDIEPAL